MSKATTSSGDRRKKNIAKRPTDMAHGEEKSVDWRGRSELVSPVRLQTKNICWAISVAASIEAAYNIGKPSPDLFVQLSAQDLANSVPHNKTTHSLNDLSKVFRHAQHDGVLLERDCPFVGKSEEPKLRKRNQDKNAIRITNFEEMLDVNEIELLNMVRKQPVVAELEMTNELQELKKDEIYKGLTSDFGTKGKKALEYLPKHAVLIVGFDTDPDGTNYWWIKSSWGDDWANDGYGKIIRHSSTRNNNSLFSSAYYPII